MPFSLMLALDLWRMPRRVSKHAGARKKRAKRSSR